MHMPNTISYGYTDQYERHLEGTHMHQYAKRMCLTALLITPLSTACVTDNPGAMRAATKNSVGIRPAFGDADVEMSYERRRTVEHAIGVSAISNFGYQEVNGRERIRRDQETRDLKALSYEVGTSYRRFVSPNSSFYLSPGLSYAADQIRYTENTTQIAFAASGIAETTVKAKQQDLWGNATIGWAVLSRHGIYSDFGVGARARISHHISYIDDGQSEGVDVAERDRNLDRMTEQSLLPVVKVVIGFSF